MTDEQNAEATDQTSMADIAAEITVPETEVADTKVQSNDNVQNMQDFVKNQAAEMSSLKEQVINASEELNELKTREQQKVLDKAVDDAVMKITDGVSGNEKFADTFLNTAYRNDPNLKKIFDNRDANPEALDKALGILKEEFKSMISNPIDPQVAENQRALMDSQRPGSTAQQSDADDKLSGMSDAEFLSTMRRMQG